MNKALLTICAMLSLNAAQAQTPQKDLHIYAANCTLYKFHPDASFTPYISNSSDNDYKDVTYRVYYVAGDGTVINQEDITYYNFISQHGRKTVGHNHNGSESLRVPRDTRSLRFSIVSAKRLD